MGNFATASRRESDPFPQPGLGAYKGTLWDPAAKIAPGKVARNSNLKFGVRPRPSPSSGRHVVKLKRELQPQAPYFAEAHAARCWAVFKFGFEQGTMVHALPSGKVSVADVAE